MGEPENLLKGKTAFEKLLIVLKYIPMFSLTAFFRVGSGVPKVTATLYIFGICLWRKITNVRFLLLSHFSGDGAILQLVHSVLSRLLLLHCVDLVENACLFRSARTS